MLQTFQASLEGLKPKVQVGMVQILVGEMPWDFWSNMMLQIEILTLDNPKVFFEPLCSRR
jgi:hypothetical protein